MENLIPCLDKGYVRLVTWMPYDMTAIRAVLDDVSPESETMEQLMEALSILKLMMGEDDLATVNAARVSFSKESRGMTAADHRLIRFLAERVETSPFRHAALTFEIKAPLMVARQWFKYRVGSQHTPDTSELLGISFGQGDDEGFGDPMHARNESSRRYVTSVPEFYAPSEWRESPASGKQGSGGPLPDDIGQALSTALISHQAQGVELYEGALARGVAAEQARLFLPAYGLYLMWRWTGSVASVCHFLRQRLEEKAQAEIQEYAKAVLTLVQHAYPASVEALVPTRDDED